MVDEADRFVEPTMARCGDVAICERPKDQRLPKRIDVYAIEGEGKVKLDPFKLAIPGCRKPQ
jgi:hypothetical protein